MNYFTKVKKISIVYFSGTGGTKRVALELSKNLKVNNTVYHVNDDNIKIDDMLILLAPVHASDLPYPIYNFIKNINSDNKPAVVISVSGGGEVFPNKGCRWKTIKTLTKRGFNVVYEDMLVMPSNFLTKTPDAIAYKLFEVLPLKINRIVNDLKKGIIRRSKPNIFDKWISLIFGTLEKKGVKRLGKKIKVSDNCNGCAVCVKNCPTKNITLKNNKPTFSNKCSLCLKCFYICPKKAIHNFASKLILKDFKIIHETKNPNVSFNEEEYNKVLKNILWKALRKYIEKI